MAGYLSQMAALGVVGFDPLGAVVMLAFIAGGARFVHTAVFTLVNWLTIVVLGAAAGSALGVVLAPLRQWFASVPRWTLVTAEIGAAIVLVGWAIARLRAGLAPEQPEKTRLARPWALIGIAAGLAVSMFADPGYAGAVLAGASHPVWWQLIGLTLWYLIAMSSLVVVCIADGLGAIGPLGAWLHRWLSRSRRPLWRIGTALIVVTAALLVLDALLFVATGRFLP